MSGVALYVLAAEYQADLAKLAELDLDPATLRDILESLGGELEAKAVNVAMFIRNLEVGAEAIKQAETELKARRERVESRAESLRAYLKGAMEATGVLKIEHPMLRLSIKALPGKVVVFDELQVPPFFWREPPPSPPPPARVIDKAAIKTAIADGETVPGAKIDKGTRLEIKS